MLWQTKFFDDFDNNSVDILTDPGDGAVTEPVGSELQLYADGSVNVNWANGVSNAPVAYTDLLSHLDQLTGLIRMECRWSSRVAESNRVLAGICLWKDRQNAYQFGWYDYYDDMYVQKIVDGTTTTSKSSGNYGDPNTTAHIYRIYWNRSLQRIYISELDLWMEPNELGFEFSADDGTSWTWYHSEQPAFKGATRFGVFFRHPVYSPETTLGFDYLKLEEAEEEARFELPEEDSESQDAVSVEEETTVLGTGGPAYGDEVSHGLRIPGPPHQTVGSQGPFDEVAVQDEVEYLSSGPTKTYGLIPDSAARVDETSQIDDSVVAGIVDADYMVEKDDGDGVELVQGTPIEVLKKIASGDDPWGSPSAGFYGTARNGKNYYDGDECTPSGSLGTSFGTTAGGPNRVCWPFWGGAAPLDMGLPAGCTLSIPSDDDLNIACTGLSSEFGAASAMLGWYLSGDFDVQVDFANWAQSGGSYGRLCFRMLADEDNYVQIQRRSDGGYFSNRRVSGSDTGTATSATSDTSGKLRITRSGSVLQTYYWDDGGSAWVQLGTDHDLGRVDPMFPQFWVIGAGGTDLSVDLSNFTINSGSVINTVAWSREALGDHRGNSDASPSTLGLVGTRDSLGLVDLTATLLWMRFTEGLGQALNSNWGGTDIWVHDVAFIDGVMLIAWHGALVRVDFNLSDIRIGRLSTDSNRGAVKRTTHGNGYPGMGAAGSLLNSQVITRNENTGFTTPALNDWAIPSRDVNSVDLWHDGGYEYRVVGTAAGLRVQKWRRWYFEGVGVEGIETPEYSSWDTSNAILWTKLRSDGVLFWMDNAKLYSRSKTGAGQGWEDWMTGGSFSAENEKDLPGTRWLPFQYRGQVYSSYVFVPTNEGVYRVNWPSGSWELFYGNSLSGATHAILPDYKLVSALALGNDGTTDLLIISLEQEQKGQVVAVRLSDNTVYALAKIVDLKVPSVVTA